MLNDRTWLEVNILNMKNNIQNIKSKLNDSTLLMAVIKGNGYGVGIESCVQAFDEYADFYGVATIEEAYSIRESGSEIPVLVLGYIPLSELDSCIDLNILPTLINLQYAKQLNNVCHELNKKIKCHLAIDTGFNRLGIKYTSDNFEDEIEELTSFNYLNIEGIYTHFSTAGSKEIEDVKFQTHQYSNFTKAIKKTEKKGLNFKIKHCSNSKTTVYNPEYHMDMVRVGMNLFGISNEYEKRYYNLKNVMSWKANVVEIKTVEAQEPVNYSRSFISNEKTKIAVISCGFADGYFRPLYLVEKALVIAGNKKVRIAGKINMDYMLLDISNVESIHIGDDVTLLGCDKNLCVDPFELGRSIDSTATEIVTHIGPRVKRILIND